MSLNNIKIAGFIKHSLVDYPGYIASVIFMQGCNFRCFYCHNRELVLPNLYTSKYINPEYVISYLSKNSALIDALVVTGGEPTIQSDLSKFLNIVKTIGIKIKLDTNGTNYQLISLLLDKGLIDYIAMDIKTILNLEGYSKITGPISKIDFKSILNTIKIIKHSGIDYEFRTTVLKYFHTKDTIEKIGEKLKGSNLWAIQNCQYANTLEPVVNASVFSENELNIFLDTARQFVKKVVIRHYST